MTAFSKFPFPHLPTQDTSPATSTCNSFSANQSVLISLTHTLTFCQIVMCIVYDSPVFPVLPACCRPLWPRPACLVCLLVNRPASDAEFLPATSRLLTLPVPDLSSPPGKLDRLLSTSTRSSLSLHGKRNRSLPSALLPDWRSFSSSICTKGTLFRSSVSRNVPELPSEAKLISHGFWDLTWRIGGKDELHFQTRDTFSPNSLKLHPAPLLTLAIHLTSCSCLWINTFRLCCVSVSIQTLTLKA